MSENSGEQFQITKHYLECRSVENARYPTLLACIFLLTYIVLPVVLAPEQIFFADFITCLAISLYALGYLSITAYASPSFLILPKRKNRARKSLVTLAAFEAMLLLGCSGVWLLIGMAVNKDPNWHYLISGILLSPIISVSAVAFILPFMTAKRAEYLFFGAMLSLWGASAAIGKISDSHDPTFVVLILVGIPFALPWLLFRRRFSPRSSSRQRGELQLVPANYRFQNSSDPRTYVWWSFRAMIRSFPVALLILFGDDSASRWTARRFRQRSLFLYFGHKLVVLPVFGVLVIASLRMILSYSPVSDDVSFLAWMWANPAFWFSVERTLETNGNDDGKSQTGQGWSLGLAASGYCLVIVLSLLIFRISRITLWLLLGVFISAYIFAIRGYRKWLGVLWFERDVR
jgi:hypothetical protein